MADSSATRVCLGLLCGIPASGKSSLAACLQDHVASVLPGQLHVLLLHYDRLIPAHLERQLILQTAEQGGSRWKSMRNQIVTCVDCLLNLLVHVQNPVRELTILCENPSDPTLQSQHQAATTTEPEHLPCIVRPSSVDFALWERFILSIHDSLKAMLVNENSRATGLCSWLVLIDDNMQYSSMRYEYCQLARKYEVGLCTLYVACPLEEALERNRSRAEDKVDDHVIVTMHERIEIPESDKHPWERHCIPVDGTATTDFQAVLEIVHQAMADPQRPSLEKDTDAKVISRYICSTNTIHQADQILRRCVSLRMVEAKGAGCSKEELKALSADLAKLRTLILSGMKKGEITLPFQPEENSISDASKDTDSSLFQFVQGLFAASSTVS